MSFENNLVIAGYIITGYETVLFTNTITLKSGVNALIKEGYVPTGGICVTQVDEPITDANGEKSKILYAQSMVKIEKQLKSAAE